MREITFAIDGPLYGYRASTSKRTRKSDGKRVGGAFDPSYIAFKRLILLTAQTKGWKGHLISLPDWIIRLSVFVYWSKQCRLDWSNAYKAVEDALFSQDRYVHPGGLSGFLQNSGPERMVVTLEVSDYPPVSP